MKEKEMNLDKINKKEVTNTKGEEQKEINIAGIYTKERTNKSRTGKIDYAFQVQRNYFAYYFSLQCYQRTCTCVPSSRFSRHTSIRLYMQIYVRDPLTCQQKAI
jgi:hypothetical protein